MTINKNNNITIPKFLYDTLSQDSNLIKHLAYYRGQAWINIIRKEMENDKKYSLGIFKKQTMKLQTMQDYRKIKERPIIK